MNTITYDAESNTIIVTGFSEERPATWPDVVRTLRPDELEKAGLIGLKKRLENEASD